MDRDDHSEMRSKVETMREFLTSVNWSNLIATGALLASATSLYYSNKAIETSEKYEALAIQPRVTTAPFSSEHQAGIKIANLGNGTAYIMWSEFRVDGKLMRDMQELYSALDLPVQRDANGNSWIFPYQFLEMEGGLPVFPTQPEELYGPSKANDWLAFTTDSLELSIYIRDQLREHLQIWYCVCDIARSCRVFTSDTSIRSTERTCKDEPPFEFNYQTRDPSGHWMIP